jgi:hypothetical protein
MSKKIDIYNRLVAEEKLKARTKYERPAARSTAAGATLCA